MVLAFNQSAAPHRAFAFKQAASAVKQVVQDKVNCTSDYSCPDNSTCCHLDFGAIACCPLPRANCCATTHGRCCPEDFDCSERGTECSHKHNTSWVVPSSGGVASLLQRQAGGLDVPLT